MNIGLIDVDGGKDRYCQHLSSEAWAAVRRTALRRSHYSCSICGAKRSTNNLLHVHHLTYERFGSEEPDDVVVLCEHCHNEVHEYVDYAILKSRPYMGTVDENGWEYDPWIALPHMRHASVELLAVIFATLYHSPLRHCSDGKIRIESAHNFEFTCALTDKDGTWRYTKCPNWQAVCIVLFKMGQKGYNVEKAKSQCNRFLEMPAYIRYDDKSDDVTISDELHARYEIVNDWSVWLDKDDLTL